MRNKTSHTFIVSTLLLLLVLTGCSSLPNSTNKENTLTGLILPHHLIIKGLIKQQYEKITSSIANKTNTIERVILISPNHFNYGTHYIQTTDALSNTPLDVETIHELANTTPLSIEPKYYPLEHGIYNHTAFIEQYIPTAKIVPIIIKRGTPQNQLDFLLAGLKKLDLTHTLIIASVDFSHYVPEHIALKNDNRTIDYLQSWIKTIQQNRTTPANFQDLLNITKSFTPNPFDGVAMDSPESIYAFLELNRATCASQLNIIARTSSMSLIPNGDKENGAENTSHIFTELTCK